MTSPEITGELSDLVRSLRAAGCVYAEDEADVLLRTAISQRQLETMLAARVAGLPLEQVVGWAEFAGCRVLVEPGVFVPRRRTELLVRAAVELAPPGGLVVDLCCGSGAVAAAVLTRRPDLTACAADLDPVAVRCARRNLPAALVTSGDLYDALPVDLRARVDVLTVNAPYVPTNEVARMPREARLHEPISALDGGPDGCSLHRRVAAGAAEWLAPGGHVVLETSRDQLALTSRILASAGLTVSALSDDDLDATAVVGRLPSPGPGRP